MPAPPATFSPILGKTPPRRALTPAAFPPSAGFDLSTLQPLPAERARIEALVFSLIDWLDAQDAPQADLKPDNDTEESGDAELSEPTDDLAYVCERLGFSGYAAGRPRAAEPARPAQRRGGIG